jgi:hypothetical protein
MAQNEIVYTGNDKESRQEKRESAAAYRTLKRNERGVSYQSNQQFLRDFPNAENVNWNVGKVFEEVIFTDAGIKTTAYYDHDSQLVGTTSEKTFADIPVKAQENIKNHYKGYNVETVILFDDNEDNDTDMTLYGTSFEDADNYFVALKNDKEFVIVKADMEGAVSFFKKL